MSCAHEGLDTKRTSRRPEDVSIHPHERIERLTFCYRWKKEGSQRQCDVYTDESGIVWTGP